MLKVSGVQYQYNGAGKLSFPDITLSDQQQCLLIGKSGCGKTTFLHLMGGLLKHQQGNIDIENTDISTLSNTELDKFRGQHIGLVFQKPHLIKSLTVVENIKIAQSLAGLPADNSKLELLLDSLDLVQLRNKKPATLSQGQEQRVAIARALINSPKLILVDEPTASLDDDNAAKVISLLTSLAKQNGANLLVATHDYRVKNEIDNHIILGEG